MSMRKVPVTVGFPRHLGVNTGVYSHWLSWTKETEFRSVPHHCSLGLLPSDSNGGDGRTSKENPC